MEERVQCGYGRSLPPVSPMAGQTPSGRGYGNAGGTRRLVACSKAYPSSMSRGSLQAMPVKLTPNGPGFASNASGNGGKGAFGTVPNGTITVGYSGFAAMEAPLRPGKGSASRRVGFLHRS